MKLPIPQSSYESLFNEISDIYENARRDMSFAMNKILVETYWQIGKRIVTVEQKNKVRAEYGARLLERLSEDLTQKYFKGFSVSNLKNMRQFYVAYPIRQTSGELKWSQYKILSSIKDPDQRTEYEQKSIKNNWKTRDLAAEIKKDKVALEISPEQTKLSIPLKPPRLSAQPGQLGLAKIVDAATIHDPAPVLEADVGFYVTIPLSSAQQEGLDPGQLVRIPCSRSGNYDNVTTKMSVTTRYTYKAWVLDVVDGDTLKAKIKFKSAGNIHPRLRLRGINTPEMDTPKGPKAMAFVQERLKDTRFVIIRTHSLDLHGRYISDVWYLPNEKDVDKVLREGIYLNQELLDRGLAVGM